MRLLDGPWRGELGDLAASARQSVVVAAPFIKDAAAMWLCGLLHPGVRVLTIASLAEDAVRRSALDLTALVRLAGFSPGSRLFSVARLHAKIFAADEHAAIVTSGNLTGTGLDENREYGVRFDEAKVVRKIRTDMFALADRRSAVDLDVLEGFVPLQSELRAVHEELRSSADAAAQRRFRAIVDRADRLLVATQVGRRSANALFAQAIRRALSGGSLPTSAIQERVRSMYPRLCDDSRELIIRGERYGKAWKHRLRNAQQHLKRRGELTLDSASGRWALVDGAGRSRDPSIS